MSGPHEERWAQAIGAAAAEIEQVGLSPIGPGEREGGVRVPGAPVPVPDGWLFIIDTGPMPPHTAAAILDVLVEHLSRAGVEDAVIGRASEIDERHPRLRNCGPVAGAPLSGP